ncbi:MAG TPA: ABC transporter permease [Pseudomonadales bacterium]|nr:ABC transporter permease [Pseudomonadales bacterium]
MRLGAQIVKELLVNLRDGQVRLAFVGPPLLQVCLLAYAATLEVRNVDIAVVIDDTGRASHELVQRIGSARFVHELVVVHRAETIAQLVDRRKVLVGVHIAADFSRDVAAGRPASVQVLVDGRRGNSGQIALSYLQNIANDYGAELTGSRAAGVPRTEVRNWFNENLIYLWFVLPAMTGILVMFTTLVVTALSIAKEREQGTFDQLLVSPSSPLEIVIAKCVPAFIIAIAQAALMVSVATLIFDIPFAGSLPLLLLAVVLFGFSLVGIGLMLSAICETQQQAILSVFAVGYPLIMISGFATPVENMPDWLQTIAEGSPLKHFLVIVQGSFSKAMPPIEVWSNAWPMLVIGLISLAMAMVIVKRKLQ